MSAAATKGPYIARDLRVATADGLYVLAIAPVDSGLKYAEKAATMTLFAASDDLLAVARLVADGQHRKNCWLIIDGDGPCDCIVGLARSALAKAEGRTPEGA